MAKWIFDDFDGMGRHYHCSKCGYGIMVKENLRDWTPNKCSNCKTEMETRESRAIDAESLKDKLNDVYGDSNNLIYLYAALDLIDTQPTLTPPNEPLTCDGCTMQGEPDCYTPCSQCIRDPRVCDYYDRRPPEGEA